MVKLQLCIYQSSACDPKEVKRAYSRLVVAIISPNGWPSDCSGRRTIFTTENIMFREGEERTQIFSRPYNYKETKKGKRIDTHKRELLPDN